MKDKVPLAAAEVVAKELIERLRPACERITVAGSIRRRRLEVSDIELLAIPQYLDMVDHLDREIGALVVQGILGFRKNKLGSRVYGPKNKFMRHLPSGIGVDIFSTTEECWAVSLAIRTGPKESNMAVAVAAQRKGWRLRAYGSGFDTPNGPIQCKSERDVFEFVGLLYKEPRERD